jgi:D-alanyl-D-alanine carboxypeptidase/D-alanyl-D-alanine-endopeptidase (penicillin-binding protein 4)
MLFNKKKYLIVLFICSIHSLWGQNLPSIEHAVKSMGRDGATVSCVMYDIKKGTTHYAFQPNLQVTPASVLKLITTATALELLGDDYRFKTSLSYSGTIQEGVLHGNLYIIGSGDPSLGSRHIAAKPEQFLQDWAAAVKRLGVHTITGDVIADATCLDDYGVSNKWLLEDLGSYYGTGSYGINLFDNAYKLYLQTGVVGSKPQIVATEPNMGALKFHNNLIAQPVVRDSSYILGMPLANERFLYGVVPTHRKRYALKGDIPNPMLCMAQYSKRFIEKQGVKVQGVAKVATPKEAADTLRSLQTVRTVKSPQLKELIKVTNYKSQNLYADALLKQIGVSQQDKSQSKTNAFDQGVQAIKQYWTDKGIDTRTCCMYDGSGLAVTNKVSAQSVVEVLAQMHPAQSQDSTFYHSLPIAGVEGTVRNFLKTKKVPGELRLKSGSMSRVRAYAGYWSYNNQSYAVAFFINNYNLSGRELTPVVESFFQVLLKD